MNEEEIKAKIQEYVTKKQEVDKLQEELDYLKTQLDASITEDHLSVEGVGVFSRKASFVRQNFDKKKAKEYLTEEQFNNCLKESNVKGSVSIMSWDSYLARKNAMENEQ